MACFFHSPTIVGWMPCLVANCAVVSSPRSASSATFALNSTEYRCRLLVIQVRPSQERTELKPLSKFAVPPQCLDRRIADKQTLIEEVDAWEKVRNKKHTKADWQFTTANARVKLKRLYPSI